jgi:hypothetical protein
MAADLSVGRLGDLWAQLRDMRIEEPGASRTFEQALAEENHWSLGHATAVGGEYRRFLYLAAIAEFELTPSVAVDKAWHLHLTYTRHYWDVLCARILERPLHHIPGSGSEEDEERYGSQYARTLSFYAAAFREQPPESVWPRPQQPAEPAPRRRLSFPALLAATLVTGAGTLCIASGGFAAAALIAVGVGLAMLPLVREVERGRGSCGGVACGGGGGGGGSCCAGCGASCGGGCGGGCGG